MRRMDENFKRTVGAGLLVAGAFFVGRIFQGTKDIISVLNDAEEVNPGSKKKIIANIVTDVLTKKDNK